MPNMVSMGVLHRQLNLGAVGNVKGKFKAFMIVTKYVVGSNALSFYMFRNVLGWSKSFVPDQKSIVAVKKILCQTKR